jgi:hypothetical protein
MARLLLRFAVFSALAWSRAAIAQDDDTDAQQATQSAVERMRACVQAHANDSYASTIKSCSSDLVRSLHPEGGPAGAILGVQETTGSQINAITDPASGDDLMNKDVHTAPTPEPTPTQSSSVVLEPSNGSTPEPSPSSEPSTPPE